MFNNIIYDNLKYITEKQKPYRGRPQEEYPLYRRSDGNKYFRPSLRKAYYDIYYCKRNLLRVHKGNIVEYMYGDYLDCGDIRILNYLHEQGSFRQGWWYNGYQLTNMDSRGGLCMAHITDKDKKKYDIYPLRKGMKFDMLSDIPITKYDVLARQIDRKASAKTYKDHANDYTILNTTFKGISDGRLAYDFCQQVLGDSIAMTPEDLLTDFNEWVTQARAKSQIDGLICSARSRLQYKGFHFDKPETLITMIWDCYKDYLNEHYNNFKIKEYPCEKKYFPSNKHLKIQMREKNDE
mgnify:FL=1